VKPRTLAKKIVSFILLLSFSFTSSLAQTEIAGVHAALINAHTPENAFHLRQPAAVYRAYRFLQGQSDPVSRAELRQKKEKENEVWDIDQALRHEEKKVAAQKGAPSRSYARGVDEEILRSALGELKPKSSGYTFAEVYRFLSSRKINVPIETLSAFLERPGNPLMLRVKNESGLRIFGRWLWKRVEWRYHPIAPGQSVSRSELRTAPTVIARHDPSSVEVLRQAQDPERSRRTISDPRLLRPPLYFGGLAKTGKAPVM